MKNVFILKYETDDILPIKEEIVSILTKSHPEIRNFSVEDEFIIVGDVSGIRLEFDKCGKIKAELTSEDLFIFGYLTAVLYQCKFKGLY